jgi:site-specific DNA-methyltransferase (adenine-specific)
MKNFTNAGRALTPDLSTTVYVGDALATLRKMPSQSVHCCVTSPPYYGLRDYGVGGQIGLEETPDAYIARLVSVFAEVHRVLRDDGTLWLNIGDSYAATTKGSSGRGKNATNKGSHIEDRKWNIPKGLKPKDLIGIPWMLAFALRADGWYLRQDIIWEKPNPMPESVADRCTKAHEYIFLFSKKQKYYFNAKAIRELAVGPVGGASGRGRQASAKSYAVNSRQHPQRDSCGGVGGDGIHRNKRSVWRVATKPYKGAHFATFPTALIEPCVLAGCPPYGTVLDPFMGAGTTGLVANGLRRRALGCELNTDYAKLAADRLRQAGHTVRLVKGAKA